MDKMLQCKRLNRLIIIDFFYNGRGLYNLLLYIFII